jgi:predicted dehydrogenase
MARRLNVPEISTDYHSVCARRDIDAIAVASPDVFHARHALAALEGGKHVFCEKPLGVNMKEALSMLEAANRIQRIHQVGFTYRYLYGVQELKRRVLQGDIGDPYYIRLRHESWDGMHPDFKVSYREKLSLVGGGVLHNVGSHLFDLSHHLIGRSESITGFTMFLPRERRDKLSKQFTPVETDDIAAAWYRCGAGVRGEWFASRASPSSLGGRAYVEVVGTEGALRASLSRGPKESLTISRPDAPEWVDLCLPAQALDGEPHCLALMMRSFVDACLRGSLNETTDASFHDGMMAQKAIGAIEVASCD